MKLELIEDVAGLRSREAQWTTLYRQLPKASIFTSPGWVLNWIESFAPQTSLCCMFASDSSGLRAVLPLLPVAMRWRRLPVTALVACTNAHSVRSTLLFDVVDRTPIFDALANALRGTAGWDLLLLDGCATADGQSLVPPLPRELPVHHWQHYALTVRGTWAQHHATLGRDLRRNLRRAESDLSALGRVRFDVVESDADRMYEQWVEVDHASWKASAGEIVESSPETRSYYRRMVQGLALNGQLLGGVLMLDDRPIAALMCMRDKGVVYTLKTATRADLSSARLSLNAVAVARLLQTVWARRDVQLVDFVNKQPYTERWTSEKLEFERRVAFAPSWRGHAAQSLERFHERFHALAARRRPSSAEPVAT